jgi:pyruvate dehydrogenase E1 component
MSDTEIIAARSAGEETTEALRGLERQALWLASWMIHNANHVRPSRDGVKVGGHQASSASLATILTALYFHVLRPEDRVAVKPHASPVFHAIQYMMGRQTRENLERFRGLGGAQSYPSRTKDYPEVDFSTGSVGLGVAATLFASLVQDYVRAHERMDPDSPMGRMIALVGDAELDEGNVYEALLDGWKHDLRNCWWIIDYNRQSLDGVVNDALFKKISGVFDTLGWNVTTLKYGKKLEAIRDQAGGEAVLDWIDKCNNQLYSALTFKGGPAWRERLSAEIGDASGVKALLDAHDDDALHALMTNLAGHDMASLVEAFEAIGDDPDPTMRHRLYRQRLWPSDGRP